MRSPVEPILASRWFIHMLSDFSSHFRLWPLSILQDCTRVLCSPRCGRLKKAGTGNIRTFFLLASRAGSRKRCSAPTVSSFLHAEILSQLRATAGPHHPTFARHNLLPPLAHSLPKNFRHHAPRLSVPFRSRRGGLGAGRVAERPLGARSFHDGTHPETDLGGG